jgi:hypothetical protein
VLGDRPPERRAGRKVAGGKLKGEPWLLFAYRLAAHHRIIDIEQVLRMPLPAIRRWLAFYRLEPFGDDWRRTARLAMVMSAAYGAKVKEDAEEMFLPTYDPSRPTQTPEEMARELAKLKQIASKQKKKAK